jgi:hypothetical protein
MGYPHILKVPNHVEDQVHLAEGGEQGSLCFATLSACGEGGEIEDFSDRRCDLFRMKDLGQAIQAMLDHLRCPQ